jgi:hypothetical protein
VKPTDEQLLVMQNFRDKIQALYEESSTLPASRNKSLALTKLEESAMSLNKAITNSP